jgi:hypothetical protein
VFHDDFSGSLNPAWSIVRLDASYYSVQSTGLVLRCNSGDIWTYRTDALNLFLIPNPAPGDFTVTAKLRWLVAPSVNYAQFDLLAYDDDDNHVRLLQGFLSGTGLVINNAVEIAGGFVAHNDTAVSFGTNWFWLQMRKQGTTYSGWYSTDGVAFIQASSAFGYGDGTPVRLGFVAMRDPSQTATALIDSFTVEDAPVPASPVRLNVTSSNGTVVLSWAKAASDWDLEFTTNLVTVGTNFWTLIPPPYPTNATDCVVAESNPTGTRFFRLRKP